MNTRLPVRPKMETRIVIPLPEDEKWRLFECAAERRISAAELVRRAVEAELTKPAA